MVTLLGSLERFDKASGEINGPKVLDEALNAVEVLQRPSPAGLAGNMIFYGALSLQATCLQRARALQNRFPVCQSYHGINQRLLECFYAAWGEYRFKANEDSLEAFV